MARPPRTICSIVLAAGRARRMGPDSPPKACITVEGRPVLDHILSALEAAGVHRHCIVVGDTEPEVRQAAGKRTEVLYARQPVPRGTGDAVKCALAALDGATPGSDLLVIAGDKIVDPGLLSDLVAVFTAHDADLAFVVGDAGANPLNGRVVLEPNGRAAGILEVADLKAAGGRPITVGRVTIDPSRHNELLTNQSIYLFKAAPLVHAAGGIGSANAQGEFYLTDTVEALVREGRTVVACPQRDADQVLSFNTREELRYVRQRRHALANRALPALRPVTAWLAALDSGAADPAIRDWCGGDEMPRALAGLRAALLRHLEAHGDLPTVISRAPGRANLMGRHIDHQGGHVNMMAIPRAAYVLASASTEPGVTLVNTDPARYPDRAFEAGPLPLPGEEWQTFVDSAPVRDLAAEHRGDWGQYVRAAVVRLSALAAIPGLRMTVHGDIPVAAGLSSSSALVVATARAVLEIAGATMPDSELVERCGEAEWFVGTRGGAGDQGAIAFSRTGRLVQLSFLPFAYVGSAPFPAGHSLLLCHSGIHAGKTTNARDTFNQRVECYRMGREILRARLGPLAGRVEHLRDIRAGDLGLAPGEVIRLLARLPEAATREEMAVLLPPGIPEPPESSPTPFPIRGVVLFGLAECERARLVASHLAQGNTETLGRWMTASHDGDRVAWRNGLQPPSTDDLYLEGLAREVDADPVRLAMAPGGYACSTPEVDRMVDLALACPGVAGAQIAGAGLGGCMMALVRTEEADAAAAAMVDHYYAPRSVEPVMFHCTPAPGSSLLRV